MRSLLLAGVFLCVASQSFGQPDEARIARLLSAGEIDAARSVLEAGDPTELDRQFFQARVAKSTGDLEDAVNRFRAILARQPAYLNARRELAHTLLLAGYYDSAAYHFRELIRIDPDPELVARYRQFLRIVDDNQPISVSAFAAILPSTNINRGTTNAVFDTNIGQFVIDEESRAESGVGVEFGVSGIARIAAGQHSRFFLDWSVATRLYQNADFNLVTGYLGPAYEYAFAEGRWHAGPYLRYTWSGSDASHLAVGARAAMVHRMTSSITAEVSGQFEQRTFRDQDFRDGGFASTTLGLRKQLDPSLSITGAISVDRDAPEAPHQRYQGLRFLTSVSKRWTGGFDTRLSGEIGQRLYDDDFPFTNDPRRDEFWAVSASILTSQITLWGIAPLLHCTYRNTESNISFFEFDTSECRIGFTREF